MNSGHNHLVTHHSLDLKECEKLTLESFVLLGEFNSFSWFKKSYFMTSSCSIFPVVPLHSKNTFFSNEIALNDFIELATTTNGGGPEKYSAKLKHKLNKC